MLDPAQRSRAERRSAELRQHWLDIAGSLFWDGEVCNPWEGDDVLGKHHVLGETPECPKGMELITMELITMELITF